MSHSNPGQLAKNTLFLYFRLILVLGVSLFTSREVLSALGVEDYGIYNVVAGLVTMLAFLNSAMATGTQRYLSFEIGKDSQCELRTVFSTAQWIHLAIAGVIFILAETVGLWLLNHVLTIPESRIAAANWAYQCSIVAFMFAILQVPYIAAMIAWERMGIYAYLGILDVALKLAIVFILTLGGRDKLELYAALQLLATAAMTAVYVFLCRRSFPECRAFRLFSREKVREMAAFVGWNMAANIAAVLSNQGSNVLLNVFFGPQINAGRGIAMQVSGSILGFVGSFQVASAPQITKTYSAGQIEEEKKLISFACKVTFFLMLVIALPVFLETDIVLGVWLKNPPESASLFLKLVLIDTLVCTSANPMFHAIMATGNIKKYQIVSSCIVMGSFAASWLLLHAGSPASVVFLVAIVVSMILLQNRVQFLSNEIGYSFSTYLKFVALPGVKVMLAGAVLPVVLHLSIDDGLPRLGAVVVSSALCIAGAAFLFGMNQEEALFVRQKFADLKAKI